MTVPFPDKLRIRRCHPCRDETDFYVSAFPGTEATLYVRADAISLSDALAIPEVAALVEAMQDALDAWETHNESGDSMQGHWERDARAALRKIEEGRG